MYFFNKANTASSKTWTPSKRLQKDRHQIYHHIEHRDEFPLTIVEGRSSIFSVIFSLVAEFFMSLLRRTAQSIAKTSHMIHLLGSIEEAAIFPNNYEQSHILDYTSSWSIHRLTSKRCNTVEIDCASFSVKVSKKINKMYWSIW